MKVIFLDSFTLNPDGVFDFNEFKTNWGFEAHDRIDVRKTVEIAKDFEVIITNKSPLTATTMQQLPKLKMVCVAATGFNIVDVAEAKRLGIKVCNVPAYSTDSVAQQTFAFILALTNKVEKVNEDVEKKWTNCQDFCYGHEAIIDLKGKTLGLIGTGDIAKKVGAIASVFGMNIVATSKSMKQIEGYKMLSINELLAKSDFISLHCPLTVETQNLINSETLKLMKPTSFLINTARGPLINEGDLVHALNTGQIAGAAVDVLREEPPVKGNLLFGAKNILISPHVAWGSLDSRKKLYNVLFENIQAFLSGSPQNVVNQ